MVRLRLSKEEGKARRGNARWTRSALVRFAAYRRECILVKLAGHDTSHDTDRVQMRGAVTRLRTYAVFGSPANHSNRRHTLDPSVYYRR
jgi:hypothetical protein